MKSLLVAVVMMFACGSDPLGLPDAGRTFATQQEAAAACPYGWGPAPTDSTLVAWTCFCEQSCGPCPDGWHKAGPWLATCERDGVDGGVD